jgi:Flp pilus assembly protein TadG
MSIRPLKKGALSERGETLIEFALVLPLLLILTLGAVDFGRAFFVKNVLAQSAREGVRYLVVNSLADADSVRSRVKQVASVAGITVIDGQISPTINTTTKVASVSVTTNFNWMFPQLYRWIGATVVNPTPLTSSCYMRMEGSS